MKNDWLHYLGGVTSLLWLESKRLELFQTKFALIFFVVVLVDTLVVYDDDCALLQMKLDLHNGFYFEEY